MSRTKYTDKSQRKKIRAREKVKAILCLNMLFVHDTDGVPSLCLCLYVCHVFKCVYVYIFTRQGVIIHMALGTVGGLHTHVHTHTPSMRVSAGPAPDLGQGRPHSGPFHPPEPPAASVLHPHPSSLSLLCAQDCFQRLDLIWISINRMGLPDCESYQRHICI